jgi:hypothetical protein
VVLAFQEIAKAVKNIDSSLLTIDKNKVCTTEKGFLFLNEILEDLI